MEKLRFGILPHAIFSSYSFQISYEYDLVNYIIED